MLIVTTHAGIKISWTLYLCHLSELPWLPLDGGQVGLNNPKEFCQIKVTVHVPKPLLFFWNFCFQIKNNHYQRLVFNLQVCPRFNIFENCWTLRSLQTVNNSVFFFSFLSQVIKWSWIVDHRCPCLQDHSLEGNLTDEVTSLQIFRK